jgi:hypothetical protein
LIRLGLKGVAESDFRLVVQVDLTRRERLLGQNQIVRQARGDPTDLNGDGECGVLLGELEADGRDDAVAVKGEGLGERIDARGLAGAVPDLLTDRAADDAPLDHPLDTADDGRFVDLNRRAGVQVVIVHRDGTVSLPDIGGDGEGGLDASDGVGLQVFAHRPPVAVHLHGGCAGGEVESQHGDPGLSAPPDIGGDLHGGQRLGEDAVGVDVSGLGPVVLSHECLLGPGQQGERGGLAAKFLSRVIG